MNEYAITITTCANKENAKAIGRELVKKRLAACVQLFPIESIYTWMGEICEEAEVVLFIKSKTAAFEQIAASIKECHSYDLPEIIQIPITKGMPEYLRWIDELTN